MLAQPCNYSKQYRNNVGTLCCAKNSSCESSRITLPKAPISSNKFAKLIPMLFLKDLVGRILYNQAISLLWLLFEAGYNLVHHFNPLSHNIQIQILQTDLHTFSWRIGWENLFADQSISHHWGDHFINSQYIFPIDYVSIVLGEY